MIQKIFENINEYKELALAAWAVVTTIISIALKLKGMKLIDALKFMVNWTDHAQANAALASKVPVETIQSAIAINQEAAKVRETIAPVVKQVRAEKLQSKEFTVGVDIDEKGRPVAGAKFSWRF